MDHSVETREERKRRREEKRRRREEKRRRRASDGLPAPASPLQKRARISPPSDSPPAAADSFVWRKKLEHDRKRGLASTHVDEARRRAELAAELEAAKRRRAERDAERAAWEADQASAARDRELAQSAGWRAGEASFTGSQHFLRQAIRLREGRPRGSDALAWFVRMDLLGIRGGGDPVMMVADAVGEGGLEEEVERELDFVADFSTEWDGDLFNRGLRLRWWACVKSCLVGMKDDERGGVHESVRTELQDMLKGKGLDKLIEMEAEIGGRLEGGTHPGGDEGFAEIDFWTAALSRIRRMIAELRLRDMAGMLTKERDRRIADVPKEETVKQDEQRFDFGDDAGTELDMLRTEAAKGMRADEENFTDEVQVAPKKRQALVPGDAWNHKYRPRKPRYYNRVHTGYDWTKYNRTHYDHDNPPPKTVQGYRFNIFYPDLIDASKAPTYTISKTENPEVCIITFKAGPPYEDLAFKIVSRPWEHSHRRGYRCSFDRGILQMWFNFQRYRYRR